MKFNISTVYAVLGASMGGKKRKRDALEIGGEKGEPGCQGDRNVAPSSEAYTGGSSSFFGFFLTSRS